MSSVSQNFQEKTKKMREKTREIKQQQKEEAPSEAEIVEKLLKEDEQTEILRKSDELKEAMHQDTRLAPSQSSVQQSPTVILAPKLIEKGEFLIQIENILADNLGDIYQSLEPELKYKFKICGEEIAIKIEKMFQKTKVQIKQIISLIRNWLKMIPGVSRFFLEQEAKIKTDRVLEIGQGRVL